MKEIIPLTIIFITILLFLKPNKESFTTAVINPRDYTHPDDTMRLRNPAHLSASYYRPSNTFLVPSKNFEDAMDRLDLPKEVEDEYTEWIDKGFLPVAKDQMSCGGCWAFAVCATLSARIMIATNGKWDEPFGLSEQYLISCSDKLGMQQGQGCQGGIPQYAIDSIQNGGLPADKPDSSVPVNYTYFQTNLDENSSCSLSPASTCPCDTIEKKIDGLKHKTVGESHTYTAHDENDNIVHDLDLWPDISQKVIDKNVERMKKAIYFEGPFTVGIRVTNDFYQFRPTVDNFYRYDGKSPMLGGHAVTVLGWKKVGDTPVWICKNSWGDNWGYGFPKGVKYTNPITGEIEIKYKGGFWNHIMGKNDQFIESNAVGGHPDMKDPTISKYLPNNGEKIPVDWYKVMTVRDIYEHHDAPEVEPSKKREETKKIRTFDEKSLTTQTIKARDVTYQDVNNFFNNPITKYLIAGSRKTFDSIIKLLPDYSTPINEDTMSDIIDDIEDTITDYVVVAIKGSNSVKYWLIGDTNEWSPFNIGDFIGRTTDPTISSVILWEQIKQIPDDNFVFFSEKLQENFIYL